ncbi:MAG TPA: aromatic amino acid transaminase [Oligoflexia bacterium]|nr:aromatic amino acid transaminase [Oligoflexia bacterium]HMP27900.1 aromatic amino acid transaminase [Oligoflexia bacterium]
MSSPFFAQLKPIPPDSILGVRQSYNLDTRLDKIDLGVGVYQDENGKTKHLASVRRAFNDFFADLDNPAIGDRAADYLSPQGWLPFIEVVQELLFGSASPILSEQRVYTIQAVGGTMALRYGFELVKRADLTAPLAISLPTWPNHHIIAKASGSHIVEYPYFNSKALKIDFENLVSWLEHAPYNTTVLLHATCHNPTGADLSDLQFAELVKIFKLRGLLPFFDLAYLGFARSPVEDALPIRIFADAGLPMMIATSFSKNFSLYNRRVGALTVVCQSSNQVVAVKTQLENIARGINSSAPIDGAAVVAKILQNGELRQSWLEELGQMRDRIRQVRRDFFDIVSRQGLGERFSTVISQNGMFSYQGLDHRHAEFLKAKHGIYILENGRICIAAMNKHNIERSSLAIVDAVKSIG